MSLYPEMVDIVYAISQFFGGLMGFAVFVAVLITVGFSTTSVSGNTTTIGIGFGLILALLLGLLSVGPLHAFEELHKIPGLGFPNPTYYQKFWLFLAMESCLGVYWIAAKARHTRILGLLYVPLAVIGASWCSKTADLMGFVIRSDQFSIWLKTIYLPLGVVYTVLYFSMPAFLIHYFRTHRTQTQFKKEKANFEAIQEGDRTTRMNAVEKLSKTIQRSWTIDPSPFISKLQTYYLDERDPDIQQKMKKLLSSNGQPIKRPALLFWTAFADYGHVEMDPQKAIKTADDRLPEEDHRFYFDANGYNCVGNSDGWHWTAIHFENQLPDRMTIEGTATWKSGEVDRPYGFFLGLNENQFIAFCISSNGFAMAGHFIDGKHVQELIPWKKMSSLKPGKNKLSIQAWGHDLFFCVNDTRVETIKNELFGYQTIGLIWSYNQAICYNLIKIAA